MSSVHVTRPIPEAGLRILREAGIRFTVPEDEGLPHRQELLRAVEGVDGILSLLTERMDAEVMDRAPGLAVISNHAVGYDNVDVAEATRRGVLVCNTPGILTETTADFTFGLLLAAARRVAEGDRFVRQGRFDGWGPLMMLGTDVTGATLGIVGMGRIGRAVACRSIGFGMKVIFADPTHEDDEEQVALLKCHRVELEEVLERADFVTLHVPLTEATHHLIGAPELERMKPTACLVNTSRGPVVDEAALVDALRRGIIAAAALDVFEDEPRLAPGLTELENVVLAPHAASASRATRDRMATMAAMHLVQALRGQRPAHLVNPEALAAPRSG